MLKIGRLASWVRAIAAIMAVLTLCAVQCTAAEFRAMWVDAWHAGALDQADVDALLGVVGDGSNGGQLRAANCNAVIVQVRRNCDALYPSSMGEPYMSGLSPADFNGLQAVINAAHDTTGGKQRIEVHAWIVTFRTSGGTVYLAHDDPPTGSLTTLDNYWPSRTAAGAETSDKAFDPGHPLAEDYTVNVAMDIVNNFDVDGIHFDYIRFTAGDQGYNPTSIARYNQLYGLTGQPSSTDDQFDQWRRDQVTAVVRKVYAKVQASKPQVKVSGSFVTWNPSPTASTRAAFQTTRPYGNHDDGDGVFCDWDSWLQEGIVDAAVPMTYYDLGGSYSADWTRWINFEKDRHGNRHMYIGPGIYLNSLANAITELQQTRTASPAGNYADGFSGYSYFLPYVSGTWGGFAPTFTAQVTPTQDTIPDMPWKSAPTKGHISGTVTIADTGAWSDGCYGTTVSITGPESRSMLCDGTGFYAFIDLTPGTYTVTASRPGYASIVRPVTVAVGNVTGNMCVNDFALGTAPTPVISSVNAAGITATTATIGWTTDIPAYSQVQYGRTTSYGSSTTLDPSEVTSHSQTLTGLTPGTLYHYRVISGSATSGDYTFTTVATPVITNVTATGLTTTSATITWNTDQSSSSQVQYGLTTSYGSSTTLDPTYVTSHSQGLSGLTPGTLYHYRVISGNANGTTTSGDYTFTTAAPPVITSVQAVGITNSSATINWTTNQGATSQVEYGLTTSYGSATTLDPAYVTSHSQGLSGLTQNTLYHYRVISSNGNGTTTSGDYTFTTDGPPTLSGTQATNITSTSATVTWTTNTPSDSTVNYGLTGSYGSQQTNASMVTSHSISLTGLTANTTYHYQCVSANAYGSTSSTDLTFTTAALPTIDSVQSTGVTATEATITWNTNQPADSRVNYGLTTSYGNQQTNASLVTSHSITLTGLSPVTTYHYQCVSVNANGTATSIDYTFTTTTAPVETIVDDAAATYTNGRLSWTAASGAGYNSTYHWVGNRASSSASTCTWTPNILTAGNYDVYAIWPAASNYTGNATYTVNYSGGSTSASFSQKTDNMIWKLIASNVPFAAGTGGNVVLRNITGESNNTTRVIADAVKFVYLPPVDATPPTVSIGAPSGSVTRTGPVTYTIGYSDNIGVTAVTLANGDVTLNRTGTANGTVNVTGSGLATRTVTVSGITGNGTLSISIAAGTASDAAGNTALAAGPSAAFTVDNTAPTVSIGAPSATLTKGGPVTYTITYSGADSVTLANADVTLNTTGTANGTVAVTGTGSTSRTVTISSITGNGTVGISVAAGTASDSAGNTASAAGPSATFTVDNTAPTVSIGAPSATLTKGGPVAYTITYSGADSVTLANADVTLNTTGTASGSVAVSGSGTTTRTVTVSSVTGDGSLGISIATGTASDSVGNTASAAGPSTTFVVDNTGPVVGSITVSPLVAAVGDPVHVTVSASDASGVASVTANLAPLSNSGGDAWTGNLTAIDPRELHVVNIVASDSLGNSASDATQSYRTAGIVGALTDAAWQPVMLNSAGMYVFKFAGTVTEIDEDHFSLGDGSARPITVDAPGYRSKAVSGDRASVRGVVTGAGWIESEVALIVKY